MADCGNGDWSRRTTVVTDLCVQEACACWRIEGFSGVRGVKDVAMESGPLLEVSGVKFGMKAYWAGKSPEGKDGYYRLAFVCLSDISEPVFPEIAIRVIDQVKDSAHIVRKTGEGAQLCHKGAGMGWDNVGRFAELVNPLFGLCKQDAVVLELTVKMASSTPRVNRFPLASNWCSGAAGRGHDAKAARSIADDAAAFLAAAHATDVELKGSLDEGEAGVPAHRVILAMRSPVFQRMFFASGMLESKSNAAINVEGADRPIVQKFVKFLYSDKLDAETTASWDLLCHLLSLAHRYEVQSLVEYCSAQIAASLTEENAAEGLRVAELLQLASLKEQVMGFLCASRTRLAAIQKTKSFMRMATDYPQLTVELLGAVVGPPEKKART